MTALKVFYIIVVITHIFLNVNSGLLCEEEDVEFSYVGSSGPAFWGRLSPKFVACKNGNLQSPINIIDEEAIYDNNLQPLSMQYGLSNATLVNNGHSVQLILGGDSGTLDLDGKAYTLKQIHWHTPSEHLINGIQYDAELHVVHTTNDGSTSVMAILYRLGEPDQLIAQHYGGSLTTPPCTENVIWHVVGQVGSVSREQVEALKAPLRPDCKNNARPLQPLYGRQVYAYIEI